jgi:hypothetical protein
LGSWSSPLGEETQDDRHAGSVESQATSGVAAPMEGRQIMTTSAGNIMGGLWETPRNCQESPNGNQVTEEKWTGRVPNRREMSGCLQKRADAGVYIKASPVKRWLSLWKGPTIAWSYRAGSVTNHASWHWTPGRMWQARPDIAAEWAGRLPN